MTDDLSPETPKKDTRMLAVGLSAAAALLMIYAALTHRWLSNSSRYEEVGMGLLSSFECTREASKHCEWQSNKSLVNQMKAVEAAEPGHEKLESAAWLPAAWVTLVSIILAAASLLVGAVMGFRKITRELPIAPTTIALLARDLPESHH